jgi:hypothetical protein
VADRNRIRLEAEESLDFRPEFDADHEHHEGNGDEQRL